MRRTLVAAALLCIPLPCRAAGGVSIFLLGHTVDLRPWEVFAMYVLVFIVSVFYELLTHHIDHVVTSNSGKRIVNSIYKEVMILGGISLILTILENTAGEVLFEAVLWHYVHFVVFFMMVNLIACIAVLFLFIERSWHRWGSFEQEVLSIEKDPRLQLDEKSALLGHFFRRYGSKRADQMMACILFYRSNLPACYRRVTFTKYMMKQQRKELLCFLDVHANAWIALAVLCFVVAIQTDVVALAVNDVAPAAASGSGSGSELNSSLVNGSGSGTGSGSGSMLNDTINATLDVCAQCAAISGSGSGSSVGYVYEFEVVLMGSFILLEGYGTAFVVWLCYRKVRSSYTRFASNVEAMRREKKLQPLQPQHYYFWRGSPGFTMHILQVMLLYQVFYLATVTCNYASRLMDIDVGPAMFGAALVPPAMVTMWLIPGLMPQYTILKSVGDLLDHGTLQDIIQSEESSGMYRRREQRAAGVVSLAPALLPEPGPFDQDVEILDRADPTLRMRGDAIAPQRLMRSREKYAFLHETEPLVGGGADDDHSDDGAPEDQQQPSSPHSPSSPRRRRRTDVICEECNAQPAAVTCGFCGVLCAQCDNDYHRLKRNAQHHRIAFRANQGMVMLGRPLQSDQPLLPRAALNRPSAAVL